jgi:hypothetical protein
MSNDESTEIGIEILGDIVALTRFAAHQREIPRDTTLGVVAGVGFTFCRLVKEKHKSPKNQPVT